jgi:hypothetical protein
MAATLTARNNPSNLATTSDGLIDMLQPHLANTLDGLINMTTHTKPSRSRVPRLVPSETVQQSYLDALARFDAPGPVTTRIPKQSRVSIFHWNDGAKKEAKKEAQTQSKPQSQSNPRRKRVVAYVWVDTTPAEGGEQTGVVFYGGSVWNPTMTVNTMIKRCAEYKCNTLSDVSTALAEIKKEFDHPPPYNRRGEKNTAVGRLRKCPVVFETKATNHIDIRREISRQMYKLGMASQR